MQEYILYAIFIFIPVGALMEYFLRKEGLVLKYRLIIEVLSLAIIISFPILVGRFGVLLAFFVYLASIITLSWYFIRVSQGPAWYLRPAAISSDGDVYASERLLENNIIKTLGDLDETVLLQENQEKTELDLKAETLLVVETPAPDGTIKEADRMPQIAEISANAEIGKTITEEQIIGSSHIEAEDDILPAFVEEKPGQALDRSNSSADDKTETSTGDEADQMAEQMETAVSSESIEIIAVEETAATSEEETEVAEHEEAVVNNEQAETIVVEEIVFSRGEEITNKAEFADEIAGIIVDQAETSVCNEKTEIFVAEEHSKTGRSAFEDDVIEVLEPSENACQEEEEILPPTAQEVLEPVSEKLGEEQAGPAATESIEEVKEAYPVEDLEHEEQYHDHIGAMPMEILIENGFAMKQEQRYQEAMAFFQAASEISLDEELKFLLLMELVELQKEMGMYAQAEQVLFHSSIGKAYTRTDIIDKINRQLSYIRLLSVELDRFGLSNTPLSDVPREIKISIAEILEI